VFEERERAFQAELLRGEPPLGPGAPAAERAAAFLRGYLELVDAYLPVLLAAPRPRAPGRDLLLATTTADLYADQRDRQGISPEAIRAAAAATAERLFRSPGGTLDRSR
jgi:hypothetical protein